MGGRGGSSGFGRTGNLSKLEARRTQLESKKKRLGNKLEKIYSAEKNSDAYYKTLKARQDVTSKISVPNIIVSLERNYNKRASETAEGCFLMSS